MLSQWECLIVSDFISRMEAYYEACIDLHMRMLASNRIEGRLYYLSEWVGACSLAFDELGVPYPECPEPLAETQEETAHRRAKARRNFLNAAFMRDFFTDEVRLALRAWYKIIHTGNYGDDGFKQFMWGNFKRYMAPILAKKPVDDIDPGSNLPEARFDL